MKPLKLGLQAFGPFADSEEVDFSKLGNNPLFLINGATGAGKSSILDAICFALYGHTTGADREPSQMRCDASDAAVLTEVSLVFSLGDKRYRVRRVPAQERPMLRGDGTTKQVAEAQLWQLDGSDEGKLLVSKSVNDASNTIRELIGLDIDQFRQVMVLPQGKFRELLLADSRDREKIFSQLFQTGIYKRIEEHLKSRAAGIRQDVERHQNQIRGILQAAEVDTEAQIDTELMALKSALAVALDARTSAANAKASKEAEKTRAMQTIAQFDELGVKQNELAARLAEQPSMDGIRKSLDRATLAQGILPLFTQQQSQARALSELQRSVQDSIAIVVRAEQSSVAALEAHTAALKAFDQIEDLNREQIELQLLTKKLADLGQARTALNSAESLWGRSNTALKALQAKQTACKDALVNSEKKTSELSGELEPLADKQLALQTLKLQCEQRQQLEQLNQQLLARTEAAQQREQKFMQGQAGLDKARVKTLEIEMRWHAGQAALLAKQLQPGQPCPVCGSCEHPGPALPDADNTLVSKAEVDAARVGQESASKDTEHLKAAWDKALHELDSTKTDCTRLQQQLQELADQPLNLVEQSYQHAKQEVETLAKRKLELQQSRAKIGQINQQLAEFSVDIENLDARAREHNDNLVRQKAVVQQLVAQIPEALLDPDVVSERMSVLVKKIAQLTDALNAATEKKDSARSTLDTESARRKTLQFQYENKQQETRTAVDAWQQALQASDLSGEADFAAARMPEAEQKALKTRLDSYRSEVDALSAVVTQMQKTIANKQRPSIDVIDQALALKTVDFENADSRWRQLEARNNQLNDVFKKLQQAHKKNRRLEAQYAVIGTLSDVANGQTGDKISLQRFVLSVLLDDVLIQASQRLATMSKGRYQLVRKEHRAKGNKASGLELEVDDSYTGKSRSVATLSGGESFMAALSLALGLSDVVQSYAGGIKLDTLFIDEGFGSLDPESLDLAITTLIDLQASGRMIGIISHVSELKEQMALRLDVSSGRSGSHITVAA